MAPFARRADFWSGLALALLGAWILSEARRWVYMNEEGPGPGFFPMWYGGAMVVLSLVLVASAVVKRAPQPAAPQWGELGRALGCWAVFAASIALMQVLGFAISFALLTWFIVAVMARQPQRLALPISIGGALVFQALFEWGLDVGLPKGMFF